MTQTGWYVDKLNLNIIIVESIKKTCRAKSGSWWAVSSGFSLFANLIYFFITIIKIWNKQGHCPNLTDRPNLPDFTLYV